ncbi:MAG: glucokinase [Proteobacteria bacterium]|nr:glucokinase [Pseudomonadota bacterium]MBS0574125.1 glucokinase [Pseudomonadota bacterium]
MPKPDRPDLPMLVADIGGTNTRVALVRGGRVDRATIRRFANAGHPGLAPVLSAYLAEARVAGCAGASVAVAGPVQDGVAEMTNLDWTITEETVRAATGAGRVAILNDLQAQGHALDRLERASLRTVLPGAHRPRRGARLVIGVGTGFNAAPVHRTRGAMLVAASECGHESLPVRTGDEARFAAGLERVHGFAGVEDALSGRGLERLYAWCTEEAGTPAELSAAAIMDRIAGGRDPAADRAREMFLRLLGRVAGDLALVHLPFEGIYLVGGVARAFTPYLGDGTLAAAFRDKGRFSGFMDDFPLSVIEDDFAALEGCAEYLAQSAT